MKAILFFPFFLAFAIQQPYKHVISGHQNYMVLNKEKQTRDSVGERNKHFRDSMTKRTNLTPIPGQGKANNTVPKIKRDSMTIRKPH